MLVLGIETSCDETAVALVRDGTRILSSAVHSQVARHRPFGGVVPEIAAREHVANLVPVLQRALDDAGVALDVVDLVAVTDHPGLLPALLCGVAGAEALGLASGIQVVGVNHIEAHVIAPFLAEGEEPAYPLVSLIASGGHTHLFLSTGPLRHRLLGATIDDAAGEAFDKVARLLRLSYPGGPAIQEAARGGDPRGVPFKRPYLEKDSLDFSFSGLKTAVLYHIFGQDRLRRGGRLRRREVLEGPLPDHVHVPSVAASFQAAVVDVLVEKLKRAVKVTGVTRVGVGGGVACNEVLRERLRETAERQGLELHLAPPRLCTDNGAMVAARGFEVCRALGEPGPPPRARARAVWPR